MQMTGYWPDFNNNLYNTPFLAYSSRHLVQIVDSTWLTGAEIFLSTQLGSSACNTRRAQGLLMALDVREIIITLAKS
jgi:hypothetical protein